MIPISIQKISQSKAYTAFHIGTEENNFPIYCAPHVGHSLFDDDYPRPLTHTFLDRLFDALDIKVLQVVIHDVQETVYHARIFIEQAVGDTKKIVEIDVRPSDCLPYAIKHDIPIFCSEKILRDG